MNEYTYISTNYPDSLLENEEAQLHLHESQGWGFLFMSLATLDRTTQNLAKVWLQVIVSTNSAEEGSERVNSIFQDVHSFL